MSSNGVTSDASSHWLAGLFTVLLLAGVAVVYADVRTFGFLQWDDAAHIRDNTYVHALTPANLWWMLTSAEVDYWRPLSFVSHAVDFALFGPAPGWHHVSSVVIHAASALLVGLLVILVARRTLPHWSARARLFAAGVGAALFAFHPQHVETAAWLAERDGVLCAFFYLAAVAAYLAGGGRGAATLVGTALLFMLALLSKPLAVSLPLVLLMLDVYPLGRVDARGAPGEWPWRDWVELLAGKLPYLLIAAAAAVYTYFAVLAVDGITPLDQLGPAERLVNAARSVWLYVVRFFAPVGLSPFYPISVYDNSPSVRTLLPAAGLLVAGALALWRLHRGDGRWVGLLGIHLALVGPVLGIVHTGSQSSADRYAYLPGALWSVASAIAVVALLRRTTSMPVRTVGVVAICVCVAGLAFLSQRQVSVWRDDVTLWRTVLAYYPGWIPYPDLTEGTDAYLRGDFAAAVPALQRAVRGPRRKADAHLYLALAYEGLGDSAAAMRHITIGLELAPDEPFYLQLALRAHADGKRFDAARALLARIRSQVPDSVEVERLGASIELAAGELDHAAALADGALARFGDDPDTLVLRGVIAQRAADAVAARTYYERALALAPGHRDASHNLRELERAGG